ncbi:MAG TPA: hypothetical protein VFZ35_04050 [Sphingomicrobium sp.]
MTSAPRLSRVSATAAALSLLVIATPAEAAAYIKLGDIKGDAVAGEKWFVADSFSFGVEREMKESGEKGGTEDINIGVGELQEARKSDMTLKGKKINQNAASGDPDRPVITGSVPNSTAKATPKLLESAVKGKVFARPLPRGSLTVLVPAGKCRVGARYPAAEFGTGGKVYRLRKLTVASCARASEGGLPVEEISLNYEEIK